MVELFRVALPFVIVWGMVALVYVAFLLYMRSPKFKFWMRARVKRKNPYLNVKPLDSETEA